MADLSFIYGVMEAGKTSKLLQDVHNYKKHGHKVLIIKPLIDKKGGDKIVSRIGDCAVVDILLPQEDSLLELKYKKKIFAAKAIFVDEAQFLTRQQVIELWEIAHLKDIQVFCYGLKNNFQGIPFEGTIMLYGFSDEKTELTTRCACGNLANFNARKINGEYTYEGDVVAIDGMDDVSYSPLCSQCYIKEVLKLDDVESLGGRVRKKGKFLD